MKRAAPGEILLFSTKYKRSIINIYVLYINTHILIITVN
jgi:hypothetical protein